MLLHLLPALSVLLLLHEAVRVAHRRGAVHDLEHVGALLHEAADAGRMGAVVEAVALLRAGVLGVERGEDQVGDDEAADEDEGEEEGEDGRADGRHGGVDDGRPVVEGGEGEHGEQRGEGVVEVVVAVAGIADLDARLGLAAAGAHVGDAADAELAGIADGAGEDVDAGATH